MSGPYRQLIDILAIYFRFLFLPTLPPPPHRLPRPFPSRIRYTFAFKIFYRYGAILLKANYDLRPITYDYS
jgi:hypothetical protein